MSLRSAKRSRRTVLAVPGSSERFLQKAPGLATDMVMLDLEDAVAPGEKEAARGKVARAIRELDWGERIVAVRVNAWNSPYTYRDVAEVVLAAGPRLDAIVLAKTANAGEINALDLLLSQVEREAGLDVGHVGIEPLIESAEGFAKVTEICAASPRLEAIAIGPGDLAASLGMPMATVGDVVENYPGDHYHYVYVAVLVAARTHGIQAIDGPFLGLANLERLREMSLRSRALGYDGKWAIHPDQLATINDIFTPTDAEVERAQLILRTLDDAAANEGKGAVRHDTEMFDEVNRKMAHAVLSRAGKSPRPEPGT